MIESFLLFHDHQKCWYLNEAESTEKSNTEKLAAQKHPCLHAGKRLFLHNL